MTREELAKRIKAAVAYSDKNDTTISHAMGKPGPDTLRQWKRGNVPTQDRQMKLESLARHTGMPVEFFTADLRQLWRLPTYDEAMEAEFREIQQAEARRAAGLPERRHGTERRVGDRRLRH